MILFFILRSILIRHFRVVRAMVVSDAEMPIRRGLDTIVQYPMNAHDKLQKAEILTEWTLIFRFNE